MKLKHLFNVSRYRRCASMFRRPLWAHLGIAAARRRPLSLELLQGQLLHIPNARECRPLFDWLLERSPDPLPVAVDDGFVVFHHAGRSVAMLPNGPTCDVFKEIFLDDAYCLNALDEPLETVVDIGGNIGLFALRVAPFAERVICVEPVEANLTMAWQNIVRADEYGRIILHKGAVAAESGGTARIFLSDGNACAHSVSQEHAAAEFGVAGYEDVQTISLADLFDTYGIRRCSLLKCDAEGAEFDIFRNVPQETLARIDRIALEIHLTTCDWNQQRSRALCDKLESAGFSLEQYTPYCPKGKPSLTRVVLASRSDRGGTRRVSPILTTIESRVASGTSATGFASAAPQNAMNTGKASGTPCCTNHTGLNKMGNRT